MREADDMTWRERNKWLVGGCGLILTSSENQQTKRLAGVPDVHPKRNQHPPCFASAAFAIPKFSESKSSFLVQSCSILPFGERLTDQNTHANSLTQYSLPTCECGEVGDTEDILLLP